MLPPKCLAKSGLWHKSLFSTNLFYCSDAVKEKHVLELKHQVDIHVITMTQTSVKPFFFAFGLFIHLKKIRNNNKTRKSPRNPSVGLV